MIHPDYYIFKGIGYFLKGIQGIFKFCTVSIAGIPINAIATLFLLSVIISNLYANSVKEQGVIASKTKELLSKPNGTRWLLAGAGVIIALIWSL